MIGSTLAEYFTEILRTINSRVAGKTRDAMLSEEATAVEVSPAGFVVQALFLVHQSTGLVMAEATSNKELTRTAGRQAELLTAVRSAAAARMA